MRLPGIRVFVKPFPLSNLEWQSFSEDQLVDRPAKWSGLSGESVKPVDLDDVAKASASGGHGVGTDCKFCQSALFRPSSTIKARHYPRNGRGNFRAGAEQ